MATDAWGDKPAQDPGDDFERRFWGLLRRKYQQSELVYLPAEMGGDCGIEGYSRDGIAYQCYADRNSLTLRNRTDKQKDKLYNDTCKLQKYADRITKTLDGMKIQHYFLVVPEYHAVELVQYANERTRVVKSYGLGFIHSKFKILIKTPDDYPAELRAALLDGAAKAILPEVAVDDHRITLFADEKPELVMRLEKKLSSLSSDESRVAGLRDSFIRAFLQKEKIMEHLASWPETWEAVEGRRLLCEEELEFDNDLDTSDPRNRVRDLVKRYQASLTSSVSSIRDGDAQRLSFGQVGEWLMYCPLRLRQPQ